MKYEQIKLDHIDSINDSLDQYIIECIKQANQLGLEHKKIMEIKSDYNPINGGKRIFYGHTENPGETIYRTIITWDWSKTFKYLWKKI